MVASPISSPKQFGSPIRASRGLRRPAQEKRAAVGGRSRPGIVAFMLMAGFIVPSQVTLPFESPVVSVMRGVLIVLFFPALFTFLRSVGVGVQRLRMSDVFMILTCIWILLAYAVSEGFAVAAVSGNLYVLELLGGYLAARAFFKTQADAEIFVAALGRTLIILVAIAFVDTMAGRHLVSDSIAQMVGKPPTGVQYRDGGIRALATLEHAILFGTFCAFSAVILFYGKRTASRSLGYLLLALFGAALAKSSAPLLACLLGIGAIVYDRIMAAYPWRWKLFWATIAIPVIGLFLLKSDPVATLVRHLTWDPQTGFYRLVQWQYAGAEIFGSPWFGIGQRDWMRPDWLDKSVDSMWLVLAMKFGIPAAVLFGLGLLASTNRSGPRVPDRLFDPYLVNTSRGLSIVIALAVFIGLTVHLWGVMWTLLGVVAGLRTSLEDARERQLKQVLAQRIARPRHQLAVASRLFGGGRLRAGSI